METIILNVIPSGYKPTCHASQYDVGRVIRFILKNGDEDYILSNEEIEIQIKKLDGNIVTASIPVVSGRNYIELITTEQMTAIQGRQICEFNITKGGTSIGTLNFYLDVEYSPIEGGVASDSAIHNLETQVNSLVGNAIAEQYDSENVIFDNVPTSGHGNGYAVTSEGVKEAIDAVAPTMMTASEAHAIWNGGV